MPAIQTTYPDRMPVSLPGALADMGPCTLLSRNVDDAAGIEFGKPVEQTANEGCKLFDGGTVLGITVRERSVAAGTNKFAQRDSARIITSGAIWVVVAQDVAAGDPVYVRPSNGDFQKDNTNSAVQIPDAMWETAATATGIARLRMK